MTDTDPPADPPTAPTDASARAAGPTSVQAVARPRTDTDPRSIAGEGALRTLTDATILDAADVRTAVVLGRLLDRLDHLHLAERETVLLAVALAVRAVRLGHVYVDLATVAATATPDDEKIDLDLTTLPWPDPATWLTAVAGSALTAVGGDGPADRPLRLMGTRLYLDRYWRHERAIAEDLLRRASHEAPKVDRVELAAGLARLFPANADGDDGDDLQRLAAATAVLRPFSVVAGGPGTGKTTTVARILALLHEQSVALGVAPPRVALAAPTGKAAARLSEAVHAEATELDTDPNIRAALLATPASTLHRLLGWQPGNRSRFRHDADNQLPHNVVIVDESSMVSLSMMAKLLMAVRASARLVLVGDPRQLASVEAGAVLGDIVGPASAGLHLRPAARESLVTVTAAPVVATDPGPAVTVGDGIVVLRRVHRFGGAIATLADAIERGDADGVLEVLAGTTGTTATGAAPGPNDNDRNGAITWIAIDTDQDPSRVPELSEVRRSVVGAATSVVTAAQQGDAPAALAALRSVQVLCAHRRGPAGAATWRAEIERWLRAAIPGYAIGAWYAGRPLLVTENDYALQVFNGDTGVVIDAGGGRLRAVFDRRGEVLEVRPTRLASVESLYAMTIHKAQGSQFDSVIVVLPDPGSPVLTRELLYTAVTRARTHLTIIGHADSVRAGVDRPVGRASGLVDALWRP